MDILVIDPLFVAQDISLVSTEKVPVAAIALVLQI